MTEFPSEPISPKEFMERLVPELMAGSSLAESASDEAVKLGVKLNGEGGGEWVIHLQKGSLAVEPGSREEAAFTIIQTVDDWRGALWEGRGGVFGRSATAMFRGSDAAGLAPGAPGAPPSPAAIAQLAALNGVIQIVVTGGKAGDWSTAFKLGPGAIPEQPTTKVTISDEDAQAMQDGTLDPMQAFMSGRIQILGDMTLMMQMQAISMQAAANAARES